jgi:basic amino acid/polyamine antiporter, APA family
VRIGGAIAAMGVLLSLIAGVSRTAFAMAANRELPGWLDAVHPVHKVPHRAEITVGILVAGLVAVTDLRHAIGFSSFCVLTYYAIANASAWTLPPEQRRWPRALTVAGVVGCTMLAFTLPAASVVAGAAVLALGAGVWTISRTSRAGLPHNPAA